MVLDYELKIKQIINVINIPRDQAVLILVKNGWNVDNGISAYFENPQSFDTTLAANRKIIANFNEKNRNPQSAPPASAQSGFGPDDEI